MFINMNSAGVLLDIEGGGRQDNSYSCFIPSCLWNLDLWNKLMIMKLKGPGQNNEVVCGVLVMWTCLVHSLNTLFLQSKLVDYSLKVTTTFPVCQWHFIYLWHFLLQWIKIISFYCIKSVRCCTCTLWYEFWPTDYFNYFVVMQFHGNNLDL